MPVSPTDPQRPGPVDRRTFLKRAGAVTGVVLASRHQGASPAADDFKARA